MLTLVTGGAASGKSALAETICTSLGDSRRLYIAAMRPWDEETQARIARHQETRALKGFDTLECYEALTEVNVQGYEAILLECVGNLLANEMYQKETIDEGAVERILAGIKHLQSRAQHVILVSNDVFADGITYVPSTMRYLEALSTINREIAAWADHVLEAVCGIPLFHKGGLSCLRH